MISVYISLSIFLHLSYYKILQFFLDLNVIDDSLLTSLHLELSNNNLIKISVFELSKAKARLTKTNYQL